MPAAPQPWCRVLIVDHDLYLYGSQQYVLRQADWLERQGIELTLAGPAEGALAKAWQESGRRHVALDIPQIRTLNTATGRPSVLRLLREIYRVLRGTWRTMRVARRVHADVLDANSYGWAFNEVVLAGWLLRRPTLVHLHMRVEPSPVRLARAIAVHAATATIGVSNAVVEPLPAWARRRIHVIHSGIDTERFATGPTNPATRAQFTDDPDAPIILLVARVAPGKGIDHAVRAIAGFPPHLSNAHLVIAGAAFDPAYERSMHQLGARLLGDRVHFLGPRTDVDQLLHTASAVVLPSESEGLPLSLLEAQSSGIPTVAYPAGGCAELIRHEVTGLLAEQGNVQDLSRQLSRLLTDASLAKELAANALDHVRAKHTMRGQCDAHVALLRRLSCRAQGRNL
jgi:glycosyltransferase involved in cell wall biosynthesis